MIHHRRRVLLIQVWIGYLCFLAASSFIGFLFLLKDSRLRVDNGKKSTELLVDCGLMFISLLSIVASVLLYLNWQEQLQYFLN